MLVESLESRAYFSTYLSEGVLHISETNASSVAVVRTGSSLQVTINGAQSRLPAKTIKQLEIIAGSSSGVLIDVSKAGIKSSITSNSTGGNDTIYGSSKSDTIMTSDGNDLIYSLGGDDVIRSQAGNDTINAGAGNDSIYSASDAYSDTNSTDTDVVIGGTGKDIAYVTDNSSVEHSTETKAIKYRFSDYKSGGYELQFWKSGRNVFARVNGQWPTSGYSFTLGDLIKTGTRISLPINIQVPPKDAYVFMAVTSQHKEIALGALKPGTYTFNLVSPRGTLVTCTFDTSSLSSTKPEPVWSYPIWVSRKL